MYCPSIDQLPSPRAANKHGWPFTTETMPSRCSRRDGEQWPRISIVTPSYNQAAYLEETIRSVLLQAYPNLEYIVVDGKSDDGSVTIIRKYAPWITYWVSEADTGQANAINKGFKKSTGHIMAWLNSDDCLKPNALFRVTSHFMQKPSANIVCGFREQVDLSTKKKSIKAHIKPDRFTLSRSCYLNQETVFWTRRVWDRVGELDEQLDYAIDYDLWQRMLSAGFDFDLIPCIQGVFKVHPDCKGLRLDKLREKELRHIYRKYLDSTKTETELKAEIPSAWWKTRDLMLGLGHRGYLRNPTVGHLVVLLLTCYVQFQKVGRMRRRPIQ